MLRVNEIFLSIQGESSHMGKPCIFIRLTGCNLNCKYCDTRYAATEGKIMTIGEILEKIKKYSCRLVELTGGEPLLQENIHILIRNLLKKKYRVMLETNGSQDLKSVDKRVIKIMDIKCPGSGEADKNLWCNLNYLTPQDEVKFVIGSRRDYLWAKKTYKKYSQKCQVIFSPIHHKIKPIDLADWILKDNLEVRLGLQLHKYLGVK